MFDEDELAALALGARMVQARGYTTRACGGERPDPTRHLWSRDTDEAQDPNNVGNLVGGTWNCQWWYRHENTSTGSRFSSLVNFGPVH